MSISRGLASHCHTHYIMHQIIFEKPWDAI